MISEKEKYWSRITEMQQRQTKKGLDTYGQVLEENTALSVKDRITMIEEELIDSLMYLEHLKELTKDIEDSING